MKICIVGPVNSDKYFGGVSVFTESLAKGFELQGFEVKIVTDYSNKKNVFNNIPILHVSDRISRKNPMTWMKINKIVKKENPDIILSSLEYSIAFLFAKNTKIKKVHFIHGFPSEKHYGKMKLKLMLFLDKLISHKYDYIFTNSNFSYVINNIIYGNRVDKVINIGIAFSFIEDIKLNQIIENTNIKKKNSLLYVGRLTKSKNVKTIILAIKYIEDKYNFKVDLDIVGDGKEKSELEKIAKELKLNINFAGSLSLEETIVYYKKSSVFASLNPNEPFGMTFLEALSYNCKIIAPTIGGQLDFLNSNLDRTTLVNPYDPEEVGEAIIKQLKNNVDPVNVNNIIDEYNYNNVARKIINYMDTNKINTL